MLCSTIPTRLLCNSVVVMAAIVALTLPIKSLASSNASSIAALDIRIVETLLAMNVTPIALTESKTQTFPATMLSDATELGLLFQPNLELLSLLSPRQILISPNLTQITDRLSGIATTVSLTPYDNEIRTAPWHRLTDFTRQLGKHIGEKSSAETLIRESEHHLQALKKRLPDNQPPLLIIRLMDHHHARVFGSNSMFQSALDQLELVNAWQGQSNQLGFTTVSLDALIDIDARLVVLESPFANSPVRGQFFAQGIWEHMRSLQRGDEIYLPANFIHFGALPSALSFADLLVEALDARSEH
ncbi:ABC transporter substrate-binding protein [Vreelandella nigrificans]|uniref:ABC transporter substrate-binding protein n=1 Tax=Vreelandella nigrificans TaxID=2042704 RepID=A0A2A4HIT9_9GAMM|nr:ABC transporter substrate-binding protein [Halomonas nigrificans]PCF94269.1 ABC transporter substrate-binding protein [Halomonas nigrificans]